MQIPVEIEMVLYLLVICLILLTGAQFLPRQKGDARELNGTWLPDDSVLTGAKREFEIYALQYTCVWIGVFGVVIVLQMYETFTANSYMALCGSLALPFLLQPFLFPLKTESALPLFSRYSFKANVWIAIFSFIGNYWYTHYFYSVLQARYTFPAHRLNDVPIALYFATHFYFVTYHTFSNLILRKIETRYAPGWKRTIFFWVAVLAFSYFTAFMETLTISSFPYYSFQNKEMAYRLGSAFYGLYFIVSFPLFYRIDEQKSVDGTFNKVPPHSVHQVIMETMGAGMIVLLLLDFCRIYCGIELSIMGTAYYLYQPSN